jgi:hypothetical protein
MAVAPDGVRARSSREVVVTDNGARGPGRVRRWPYLLCRGTTAGLGLLGVAQTAVAGSFLSGHYGALTVHLTAGMVMVAVAVVQAIGVVVLRRAGGPRSVMLLGLAFPVILAGLTALGMTRVLVLHVPLAVLSVVGLLRLAAWVWRTPLPARAQPADAVRSDRPVGALS